MHHIRTLLRRPLVLVLAWLPLWAAAQGFGSTDPLNTGPRGLTDTGPTTSTPSTGTTTTSPTPVPGVPTTGSTTPTVMPPVMPGVPGSFVPYGPQAAPGALPGALPPDPTLAGRPVVFGSQMFVGRFASQAFTGFNPEYRVAVGDRVGVRMWGAFTHESTQPVDAQGNIFIPNVGPVRVLGLRNAELNGQVEAQVKRTFRSSVGLYVTLEAAQPVKVYVTGFVRAPGLYGGLSSDSVLYYLDRAGGIDPDRGSYLQVDVMRAGQPRARVDLYRFLLDGRIEPLQLQDGDVIVVPPRKHTALVTGAVLNPYVFEFPTAQIGAAELLAMARPRPEATHISVVRRIGAERRSEYHPLATAAGVTIADGDEVTLTSDKYPGTILVRIEGAHLGERTFVMPYGARLKDALQRLRPAPQADAAAVQLYRRSVAVRQKELLDTSLRGLETYALTARSATSEEAALRSRESQQILEFITRARQVQPRGQVVLAEAAGAGETLLEDGDVVVVPEVSNLVMVSGEVMVPNALVFEPGLGIEGYVKRSGGYTQGADQARVLVLHRDGSIADPDAGRPLRPGDEIMVMPRIDAKNLEVARGLTQIVYQIAVAARIAFGL